MQIFSGTFQGNRNPKARKNIYLFQSVAVDSNGELSVDNRKNAGLAEESLSVYEADDGPLSAENIARIREAANPILPRGKVLATRSICFGNQTTQGIPTIAQITGCIQRKS
ncbi:MAG: hypothetical protein CVU15_05435 [Betaproteobacteria bacterium HGW-Betaproteobacteria-1]|jgi:hypothetical protein|nr:MAG: hypothetical protein CVU15_05435 [Betaproteobacteria bacterium HGW-Betaproteobacteria-1]